MPDYRSVSLKNSYGFTLVELAIVMTIIGLLIGGVLKGQELLENTRMTSAANMMQQHGAAVHTFRDVYKALPGDIIGPANYIQNCTTAPCNVSGDGNGIVGAAFSTAANENNNFWLHLSKAGLITGVDPNTTWDSSTYYNASAPQFHMGGKSYVAHYSIAPDPGSYPDGVQGHQWSPLLPASGGASYAAAIPVNNIGKLDLKIDDGRPWQGSMLLTWTGCGVAAVATVYNPNSVIRCHFVEKAGF